MITILFISDDIRSAELVARLQPRFRGRLRLAPDFDQGLKEVFDNRPAAVFIQSDISGVSGETVARHIKTLLRGDAPRIILTHAAPLKLQGGKKWFDDTVDLSLPEAELFEQLGQRLAGIAPGQWLEVSSPEKPVAGPPAAVTESPAPPGEFEFFDWEAPEPVSAPSAPGAKVSVPPPVEHAEASPAGPAEASGTPFTGEDAPAPRPVKPVSPPPSAPAASAPSPARPAPAPSAEVDSISPTPTATVAGGAAAAGKAPFIGEFGAGTFDGARTGRVAVAPAGKVPAGGRKRGGALFWSAAGGVIIAAAVAGHLLSRDGSPPTPPAERPAAVVAPAPVTPPGGESAPTPKAEPVTKPHPSFIPKGGRDAAFAKANPGWERYRSGNREFRIYREKGRLRAVQVIARNGSGIPDSFVAAALRELVGSEKRAALSRSKKGAYTVESGRTARDGEVAVYRRKDGSVRGVVISLP